MKPLNLNGADYIKSCVRIDDGERNKVIVQTVERAGCVTLTDADGFIYGEVTNLCEPFDFKTHVFYLPDSAIERPMTVHFVNYNKKPSVFFAKKGDPGQTTLSPETVKTVTREEFVASSNHGVSVEDVTEVEVCDGVKYKILRCINNSNAPVLAFALIVDPHKAEFLAGTANDGDASHTMIQTVREQAEAAAANGRKVIAATNADFFDMFGDNAPSGLCVKNGKSISNHYTMRPFFGVDLNGVPVISSFAESPELIGQLSAAVGGREIYLRDGELAELSLCEPFSYTPHPRTTVGICEDGNVIVMVVDGRLPQHSNGASLVDLATLMKYLGAQKAINLDGGGSSTFLVNIDGELTMLNRPADLVNPTAALIRPIYNSLQVVQK